MKNFINYNSDCPLCGNKLTVYMSWYDQCLFRGERAPQRNAIDFYGNHYDESRKETYQDQRITLHYGNDTPVFSFSSSILKNEARTATIHFFYVCNEGAIDRRKYGEFEIDGVDVCYYRSSGFMEMTKVNDKWKMTVKDKESNYINRHESYTLIGNDEFKKAYILDCNFEKQNTTFHYCTEKSDKVFTQVVPLMKLADFSLEFRQNLINRLDNWILLS